MHRTRRSPSATSSPESARKSGSLSPVTSYAGAVPPRLPRTQGRPPRHGGQFVFGQPDTWGTPDTETVTDTRLYGQTTARSWNRRHPKLTHRSSWAVADDILPIVEGTVIRPGIDHLPSGATPKPVWLWWSGTDATPADSDRLAPRPGPARPPGRKNTRPTPRHDVHTPRKTPSAKRRTQKSATPRPRRTGQRSSQRNATPQAARPRPGQHQRSPASPGCARRRPVDWSPPRFRRIQHTATRDDKRIGPVHLRRDPLTAEVGLRTRFMGRTH
jgi:hypothetical protein